MINIEIFREKWNETEIKRRGDAYSTSLLAETAIETIEYNKKG